MRYSWAAAGRDSLEIAPNEGILVRLFFKIRYIFIFYTYN